jgi:hypothetical protein
LESTKKRRSLKEKTEVGNRILQETEMKTKKCNAPQMPRPETVPNIPFMQKIKTKLSNVARTDPESKRSLEVDFSELVDGTIVEMIENPRDATKSLLAIWNNGQVRYSEKLEHGNQLLVPVPRDSGIIRHVRLAKGTDSYESLRILLADIMLIFHLTLELSSEEEILLSIFVISTWLVEKLPIAPYWALVGPPGCGKTSALRILNLLCRRSLLTADISSAAFYELCDRMTATVLIDEAATVSNRRELLHLLRAGTTQGFVAIRKRNSFKSYGARAISWLELPDDAALNSRCILITMDSAKRTDLLLPTDKRIVHLADKLQQQLLQFRFTNYKTLTLPMISGEAELHPRTRDLFRSLALPFFEDKETCEGLLMLLKRQDRLREVLSVYQSTALDSLYSAIHSYPKADCFRILALTENVNANLRLNGEYSMLSSKKLGNILSSLKIMNRTRTNAGYVLWFDRETREKIHSLARRYGVTTGLTSSMSARCELCQAMNQRSPSGSTTKPIAQSEHTEASDLREHREHREHRVHRGRVKRRINRKLARVVPATSSRKI